MFFYVNFGYGVFIFRGLCPAIYRYATYFGARVFYNWGAEYTQDATGGDDAYTVVDHAIAIYASNARFRGQSALYHTGGAIYFYDSG